jgi:hypothetical protein
MILLILLILIIVLILAFIVINSNISQKNNSPFLGGGYKRHLSTNTGHKFLTYKLFLFKENSEKIKIMIVIIFNI